MIKYLVDTYSSVYCLHMQHGAGHQAPGEVFDQRPDWQPGRQAPKAINGGYLFAACSVMLVAGVTYLVR
jgi:hypothetical protein